MGKQFVFDTCAFIHLEPYIYNKAGTSYQVVGPPPRGSLFKDKPSQMTLKRAR
jgi:hypothetical protein